MTEIKICGITNVEDALAAAACGVDALGFIFAKRSPRYVSPVGALEIIAALPAHIVRVGVFVNEDAGAVEEIRRFCGLDMLQLHGDETPAYCRRVSPSSCLIKAVFPRVGEDRERLGEYPVGAFLVDFRDGTRDGGTGHTADWGLAAAIAREHSLVLAGGLGPDNIGRALAAVAPRAVDINSRIERAPGKKDHDAMQRAVEAVRMHDEPGAVGTPTRRLFIPAERH